MTDGPKNHPFFTLNGMMTTGRKSTAAAWDNCTTSLERGEVDRYPCAAALSPVPLRLCKSQTRHRGHIFRLHVRSRLWQPDEIGRSVGKNSVLMKAFGPCGTFEP